MREHSLDSQSMALWRPCVSAPRSTARSPARSHADVRLRDLQILMLIEEREKRQLDSAEKLSDEMFMMMDAADLRWRT